MKIWERFDADIVPQTYRKYEQKDFQETLKKKRTSSVDARELMKTEASQTYLERPKTIQLKRLKSSRENASWYSSLKRIEKMPMFYDLYGNTVPHTIFNDNANKPNGGRPQLQTPVKIALEKNLPRDKPRITPPKQKILPRASSENRLIRMNTAGWKKNFYRNTRFNTEPPQKKDYQNLPFLDE